MLWVEDSQDNSNDSGQLDFLGSLPKASQSSSSRDDFDQDKLDISQSPRCSKSNETNSPEMLLILDTETTGLDPSADHCLEVGAILFSVPYRAVLAQQSFLLPVDKNDAERINRIPSSITQLSQPWELAMEYFLSLINTSDIIVAHNVSFDRQWFGQFPLPKLSKPWLCSMDDISWPTAMNLRPRPSVRDLALAYGVPVWSAHRALTDCIYLAEVFSRCDDLEILLRDGMEPKTLMRANVSYENRHLARNAGFRWNDPIKGAWTRRLSVRQASRLDFPVENIDFNEDSYPC